MKGKKLTVAIMIFLQLFCGSLNAGSIWAKRGTNSKLIYADDKANQIGDILTIIIDEEIKVDTKVSRDLSKELERSIGFTGEDIFEHTPFKWLPQIPGLTDEIDVESTKSMTGQSDYTDERTIEDRITVVIEDIHPNGNLVVIGVRHRDITGDKQTIQVSGIVRPRDILFDNTIRSEQVADFRLVAINEGLSENYNKPGWLGSILDGLWPF